MEEKQPDVKIEIFIEDEEVRIELEETNSGMNKTFSIPISEGLANRLEVFSRLMSAVIDGLENLVNNF